jgi:UDP-N-acetylglucosamine 2-epimerase (non-hydrolysing)
MLACGAPTGESGAGTTGTQLFENCSAPVRSYSPRVRRRPQRAEINRIVTDSFSDLLFTTTVGASENLRREGVPDERIMFVGNVMVDSLRKMQERAKALDIRSMLSIKDDYALVTLHRPGNVDSHAGWPPS